MTAPAGPARYRVKRAEVDALQWTGSNVAEMTAFAGAEFSFYPDADRGEEAGVLTSRHSSWETLIPGQWVLRGPHGLFIVGSQQFAEDYEPAGESPPPSNRPQGAVSPGDPDWVDGFGPVPGSGASS